MTLAQGITNELIQLLFGLIRYDAIAKASERSGWLPHRTVPFDEYILAAKGDVDALTAMVSQFYEENDTLVVDDIRSRISDFLVDDEAKDTLGEGLRAHETGLYRSCCRVLLPEIERVILQDWLGISDMRPLTSNDIVARAKRAVLEDFVHDDTGDLVLFDKLMNHLFVHTSGIDPSQQSSTPNRHAATHAWIPYSSRMNSLNTIILADYIFSLVTSFKQGRA